MGDITRKLKELQKRLKEQRLKTHEIVLRRTLDYEKSNLKVSVGYSVVFFVYGLFQFYQIYSSEVGVNVFAMSMSFSAMLVLSYISVRLFFYKRQVYEKRKQEIMLSLIREGEDDSDG